MTNTEVEGSTPGSNDIRQQDQEYEKRIDPTIQAAKRQLAEEPPKTGNTLSQNEEKWEKGEGGPMFQLIIDLTEQARNRVLQNRGLTKEAYSSLTPEHKLAIEKEVNQQIEQKDSLEWARRSLPEEHFQKAEEIIQAHKPEDSRIKGPGPTGMADTDEDLPPDERPDSPLTEDDRENAIRKIIGMTGVSREIVDRALRNLGNTKGSLQAIERLFEQSRYRRVNIGKEIEFFAGIWDKITVDTQTGIEKAYYWPKDADGKVKLMRDYLNKIESTVSAEGHPSQQLMSQELILVLPVLRQLDEAGELGRIEFDPALSDQERTRKLVELRKLGDVMYREFYRRLHFLRQYAGYFEAGDAQAVANTQFPFYEDQLNFLFRDSRNAYKDTQANKSVLPVWQMFRLHEIYAVKFLMTPDEKQDEIREDFKEKVGKAIFGWEPKKGDPNYKKETDPVYISLSSAQLIAERLWEMTFRRHKHDNLKMKDYSPIPDNSDYVEKAAEENKVDLLSKARHGNFAARRAAAVRARFFAQAAQLNIKLHRLDDVDFNDRDWLTPLPDEIEGFIKDELTKRFISLGDTSGAKQATDYAKDLASAIVGTRERDSGGKFQMTHDRINNNSISDVPKDLIWSKENQYVDLSNLAWSLDDLDDLEKMGIDIGWRKEILNKFFQDSAIPSEIRQHLKSLLKDGLIDYNWSIDLPAAKVTRHFLNPDGIRNEFESKTDSLARATVLEAGKVIETIKSFYYMGAKQFQEGLTLMRNFAREKKEEGGPSSTPRSIDFAISNIAGATGTPREVTRRLGKILENELYSPVADFLSYVPIDKGSWAFLLYFIFNLPKYVFGK